MGETSKLINGLLALVSSGFFAAIGISQIGDTIAKRSDIRQEVYAKAEKIDRETVRQADNLTNQLGLNSDYYVVLSGLSLSVAGSLACESYRKLKEFI